MQKDNSNSDKLDSKIKESLQNHEVPFEPSHWAEMEKMLDAAPKAYGSMKGWSYGLNSIIVVAVLSASYFIYAQYSGAAAEKKIENNEVKTERPNANTPVINTSNSEKPVVDIANNETPTTASVANVEPSLASTEGTKTETFTMAVTEKKLKNKKVTEEVPGNTNKEIPSDLFDFSKISEGLSLNKVPAFGDQIDPKAGFTKVSKEDETLKKLAQEKVSSEVNDFNLTQLNKDSIGDKVQSPDTSKKVDSALPGEKKGKKRSKKQENG